MQLPDQAQQREYTLVDVRTFLMLLVTIDEHRVRAPARPLLIAYQAEVADVIEAHWAGKQVPASNFALPGTYAEALRELASTVEELETAQEQIIELAPGAQAWAEIVNVEGNFTLATAAQMLDNLDGVSMGQNRLTSYLRDIGWLKPLIPGRPPRPQQMALNNKWLSTHPYAPHMRNGVLRTSAPQVVVTPRGLNYLARRLMQPGGLRAVL